MSEGAGSRSDDRYSASDRRSHHGSARDRDAVIGDRKVASGRGGREPDRSGDAVPHHVPALTPAAKALFLATSAAERSTAEATISRG